MQSFELCSDSSNRLLGFALVARYDLTLSVQNQHRGRGQDAISAE